MCLGNKDEITLSTLIKWALIILKKEGSSFMAKRAIHEEYLQADVNE